MAQGDADDFQSVVPRKSKHLGGFQAPLSIPVPQAVCCGRPAEGPLAGLSKALAPALAAAYIVPLAIKNAPIAYSAFFLETQFGKAIVQFVRYRHRPDQAALANNCVCVMVLQPNKQVAANRSVR